MYDCLRAMCEAAGHLSWMVDVPEAVDDRAGCIELGQVRAEVDNRTKLRAVHGATWIDAETKQKQSEALATAEEMLAPAQRAHATPCKHCSGSGRDQGDVAQWLKNRAVGPEATPEDTVDRPGKWWRMSPHTSLVLRPTRSRPRVRRPPDGRVRAPAGTSAVGSANRSRM